MPNLFIVAASVAGFLAVAIGAFAAHALRGQLEPDLLNTFQTGVQYHMYHALALFGVGLLTLHYPTANLPRIAGYLFIIGIVVFSGSLYTLAISGIRWLGAITPIGGVAFLAAWACLFWFALTQR